MDTDKPQKVVREIVTNVEDEDQAVVDDRNRLEGVVMTKLAAPCLQKVESALKESRWLKKSLMLFEVACDM